MAMAALRQIVATGIQAVMTNQPLAAETIQATDDLILHVKTTGTATTVTFTDPGLTPSGSAASGGFTAGVVLAATDEQFIFTQATLAASTGLITANFSGARTGVTAEWLRM
jgi:hypothetical protein